MGARILPFGARRAVSRRETDRLRRDLEAAIEAAIVMLDALDGDPDLEHVCEDEGAACDDEGFDGDREASLVPVHVFGFAAVAWNAIVDGEATTPEWRP
jgi:hypothetical protein